MFSQINVKKDTKKERCSGGEVKSKKETKDWTNERDQKEGNQIKKTIKKEAY